ncbi:hypothetical protein HMPREF0183_1358 [Brevibacterium mcbrellneri ATCC 49030]|uniref:Flp/Fap pilin component n=1 Tax=Brevibacterium mcbrellneri ATCC 49030 TaxID=585530 RepID=D4YN49_9MICO|nr:hypothetical protein [Brevibacterium mcbrellneri]EFG47367.1 hypothetical protein HMPREF0183_1358 [Brevibacterium mcbrellneri ATCC 49030]
MNKLELMAHKVDVNARAFAELAVEKLQERRENGQGTIEYLGIAVLISLLVAGLVGAFKTDIANALKENIVNVISNIFGNTQ